MSKIKILVVEDDKINLELIVGFLGDSYDVKVAYNGAQGLEVYEKTKPDIIITDLKMPIMDGMKMLQEIRKSDKNVRAIVLTSYDDIEYLLKAVELHLSKYLLKPVSKEELNETVSKAIAELSQFKIIHKKTLTLENHFVWNCEDGILLKEGQEVKLTPKERKILQLLFQNRGTIFSCDDILHQVWESYDMVDKTVVKTMLTGLRKKVPENLIQNIYGVGYKINL